MEVEALRGSVWAATLFRLLVHFLTAVYAKLAVRMIAHELVIIFVGSLKTKFSKNIIDVEKQAEVVIKHPHGKELRSETILYVEIRPSI